MSDKVCFMKVRLIGPYWKIAWALNFAEKILRMKTIYYSGGTGDGHEDQQSRKECAFKFCPHYGLGVCVKSCNSPRTAPISVDESKHHLTAAREGN